MLWNKLKARAQHRGHEALAYVHSLREQPPEDQARVVIFGQGRTGSTLLENLLASTGQLEPWGEPFQAKKGDILLPHRFVHGLARWRSRHNPVFHLKIYHLTRDRRQPLDPAGFVSWLSDTGWRFVYLRRRNKLRQALSRMAINHRGRTHKFDDRSEALRFKVDVAEVVRRIRGRYRWQEKEREVLSGLDYVEVVYEDDLLDACRHQTTVNRVLRFAHLEPRTAHTRHRKVLPRRVQGIVLNYEELRDCLEKHGWQEFLDEG